MARHLRPVAAEDSPAEPVTESEGAAQIAAFLRATAGRMPVGSETRSIALRQADRWGVLATCSNAIRLT